MGRTIPLVMRKNKFDIGHVRKNFRWYRHFLTKATKCFDGKAAFRICISCLVTVSGSWHFEIRKSPKRATKILTFLKSIDYLDRLEALQFTTLEKRRTRVNLIYMFKIVKGIDDIDWRRSLDFNDSKTKCYEYHFSREKFSAKRTNDYSRFVTIRQNFFLNSVAPLWNSISSQVITAQSLRSFKEHIDKF